MASSSASSLRLLGQLSSLGMSVVVALVLGFGGGMMLDDWLGTAPWLRFVGFFVGLAAAVLNVYRVMREVEKASRQTPTPAPPTTRRED